MNEIICPKCNAAFKVDEAGYADILKQVRNEEFNQELKERERLFAEDKANSVKLAEANITNTLQVELAKKDSEMSEMKSKINSVDLEKKLDQAVSAGFKNSIPLTQ